MKALKARRVVVRARGGASRKPPRASEAEVVRRARASALRLGAEKRELKRLLLWVGKLAAAVRSREGQPAVGTAGALALLERVLKHAYEEVEEAWDDLRSALSPRDLARARKRALELAGRGRKRTA